MSFMNRSFPRNGIGAYDDSSGEGGYDPSGGYGGYNGGDAGDGGGDGSSWLNDIFSNVMPAAMRIATARYATPQLSPGTVVQTRDGVMYRQVPGVPVLPTSGYGAAAAGFSYMPIALVGGAIALFVIMKGKGN